jgi:hypothetical protein
MDDVTLNTMTGGSVVATDEITNRHFQKMKMTFGADGTATDVSASNPYPVTVISIAAGDNNIGNVDIASSALPSGAATSALQTTGNTALDAIKTAVEVIDNAISGTEMQVDIVSMPSVAINNFPAGFLAAQSGSWTVSITGSVAVTGTFWQATQPVSNAGTFATQVTSIAAGDNNIGNVDVVSLPALPTGSNVIGAVTQSGTWNVGTVTAVTGITNALPAGDNNIGNVDIVTLPALAAGTNNIGDVDVLSQPARARTTDAIATALQTDAIMNGATALTPKFANISAASSGDNTLVAAVTSKKIRILSLFLMSAGTVNAYIRDDSGTPVNLMGDATNKFVLEATAGFVLPFSPIGWQETTSGEGLQLNLSAAIAVVGSIAYVEV